MGNAAQAHLDGTLADFDEKGGPGSGPRPGQGRGLNVGAAPPHVSGPSLETLRAERVMITEEIDHTAARLAAAKASKSPESEISGLESRMRRLENQYQRHMQEIADAKAKAGK